MLYDIVSKLLKVDGEHLLDYKLRYLDGLNHKKLGFKINWLNRQFHGDALLVAMEFHHCKQIR